MTPVSARNIDFVANTPLDGRGDGVQVMVHKGHAFVGHMFSDGFTVVDVRDPKHPRPVKFVAAPANTRLPITPKWKLASTLRYSVPVGAAKVYGQANATYQSSASADLRAATTEPNSGNIINPAQLMGRIDAFTQFNFALGSEWDKYSLEIFATNAFDERGQLSRSVACGVCYNRVYIVPNQPRTIGIRAGAKF